MATTQAGAIAVILSADTASFESSMDRAAASTERSMQRTAKAQEAAQKQGDKLVAAVQRQIDTFGLSGSALDRYNAKILGVSDRIDPLINRLEKMKDAQAGFTSETEKFNGRANAAVDGFKKIEEGAGHASTATAGLTREFIVIGHESLQGNISRLGGSLLVLAEYSTKAQAVISAMAGPIGVVVAIVAALAFEAVRGAMEWSKFNKELLLTGNYSAITASGLNTMQEALANATHASTLQARSMIEALASTGDVAPRLLQPMADAALRVQKATGDTTKEVVRLFENLAEAPTKWTAEHNKAYNFVTLQQYNYIKSLEEQGKKEEAALYASTLLSDHLKGPLSDSLYHVGDLAKGVSDDFAKLGNWMMRLAQDATLDEKLARTERNIKTLQDRARDNAAAGTPDATPKGDAANLAAAQMEREVLLHDKLRESERTLAKATQERYAKAGIASSDYYTKNLKEAKGETRLELDLQELEANRQKRVDAGGPEHTAEDATLEAFYRHRDRSFQDKAAQRLDDRYETRLEGLKAEGIKLDAETASFIKYGKAINDSHVALINLEVSQGKLKGLSDEKIGNLIAVAKTDDEKKRLLGETEAKVKATIAADKFVDKLSAEANAHATNATQSELATKIAEFEVLGVKKGTAAYALYIDEIERSVEAKHAQTLENKLAAQQLSTDDAVHALDEETRMLGASTFERAKATAALKSYKQAQAEIKANPGDATAITEAQIKRTDELTAAMTRYEVAQNDFNMGAKIAFQKYGEESANAGKFSQNVIGGSLKHVEDALATFVETGKLSFSSLFKYMADEFIRNWIRMQLAGEKGGGQGGGLMSLIGSVAALFSGSSGGLSTADYSSSGFATGTNPNYGNEGGVHLAGGTNNVPYDGMPAVLHKGEAVVPAAYNPALVGGSRGGGVNVTVNAPAGSKVDKKEERNNGQDIEIWMSMVEHRIAGNVAQGRSPLNTALSARGISSSGGLAKRA